MTRCSESPRETAKPKKLLSPRTETRIGAWNVRTMYDTGKSAQIAQEMEAYNLALLGLSETRWTKSGRTKLLSGQTIIFSGHEEDDAPHTQGVGLMLSKEAAGALMEWTPISPRIITARFRTKIGGLQILQCYAPTNEANEEAKTDFYSQLQEAVDARKRKDILILFRRVLRILDRSIGTMEEPLGIFIHVGMVR